MSISSTLKKENPVLKMSPLALSKENALFLLGLLAVEKRLFLRC